ncbi:MAG: DUF1653 domain-containing protein [Cytophagaceae bacterium]|jgi:hypothetical protein|nr:DUF1653 domain-containing protein [Cytophagaceae bacterium]
MNGKEYTGTYQHYKGNLYEVVGTVRHSETEEELILYYPQAHPNQWWVRPKSMFLDEIVLDGVRQARFKKIN